MAYPAAVERWRSRLEQTFRAWDIPLALVDKALHVIQYESGGDPWQLRW